LRFHAIRMGLCAVATFLPVVLTAAYGITLENGTRPDAPTVGAVLPPVAPVVLAQPPATLAALPVTLAAAPESLAIPAIAITAHAAPRREAHARHHHPKKPSHRAG